MPCNNRFFTFAIIWLLFSTTGCIEVEEIGEYWNKGFADHRLVGNWVGKTAQDKDTQTLFIRMENDFLVIKDDQGELSQARTLKVGKHYFVMVRDIPGSSKPDPSGRPPSHVTHLFKYDMPDRNTIQQYNCAFIAKEDDFTPRVTPQEKERLKANYKRIAKLSNDDVSFDFFNIIHVKTLNQSTFSFLERLSEDACWEANARYSRVENTR